MTELEKGIIPGKGIPEMIPFSMAMRAGYLENESGDDTFQGNEVLHTIKE
jgi:hypothetical protein